MPTCPPVTCAVFLSFWLGVLTLPWKQTAEGSNTTSGQRLGFDGCTWLTTDGMIDLSSLGFTNNNPRFPDVLAPDNFYYSYNPCYPFNEGSVCVNAAVCQTDKRLYYQAGDASSPSLTEVSGRPAILYQAYTDILRKTWVALICEPTAKDPSLKALGDLGYAEYHLELTTMCACPNGCSGNPIDISIVIEINIGTILDIAFLSVLLAYLVTGIVYNKVRHQASGVALLPNVTFWKALPGLVKDGCVFTLTLVTRARARREGYRPQP